MQLNKYVITFFFLCLTACASNDIVAKAPVEEMTTEERERIPFNVEEDKSVKQLFLPIDHSAYKAIPKRKLGYLSTERHFSGEDYVDYLLDAFKELQDKATRMGATHIKVKIPIEVVIERDANKSFFMLIAEAIELKDGQKNIESIPFVSVLDKRKEDGKEKHFKALSSPFWLGGNGFYKELSATAFLSEHNLRYHLGTP
ncbi:MAG: hypothetical protein ACTSXQ_01880 [Alphaproteobacteria bacterium]